MIYLKQVTQPLFPDLIWSEPQRLTNNSLLIIGGHRHNLQAPLTAYQYLNQFPLKVVVALPDVFKQLKAPDLIFGKSTPAGSLAQTSYQLLFDQAQKSLAVLIVGDLSANQETQHLILKLIHNYKGLKIITGSIIKTLLTEKLAADFKLNLILNQSQFAFFKQQHQLQLSDQAAEDNWVKAWQLIQLNYNLIAQQATNFWIKTNNQLCLTKLSLSPDLLQLASQIAYYLTIYPDKPMEALASAIWQIDQK